MHLHLHEEVTDVREDDLERTWKKVVSNVHVREQKLCHPLT